MARATWFCVDIEASGPIPHHFDMISIGAVPVVHGADGPEVVDDRFYAEIVPTGARWDDGAERVHGLSRAHLEANGRPLPAVLDDLDAFVGRHLRAGTKPVFVGHNAPFDWSFVTFAYHALGRDNPFGYKALDTKALAMGVLGVHWFDANKELLAEALTLPDVQDDLVHRADYDAWYQAHILAQLLVRGDFAA